VNKPNTVFFGIVGVLRYSLVMFKIIEKW